MDPSLGPRQRSAIDRWPQPLRTVAEIPPQSVRSRSPDTFIESSRFSRRPKTLPPAPWPAAIPDAICSIAGW